MFYSCKVFVSHASILAALLLFCGVQRRLEEGLYQFGSQSPSSVRGVGGPCLLVHCAWSA
jgi:hypothetical protein